MFRLGKIFLTTLLCLSMAGVVMGQSLEQAKKMYNEGNYIEAKPVFERFLKQAPNNASYNHWYGVCCYETGDLKSAEKHLLVASKKNVQESFRYLGELYTATYYFEQSESMWTKYIELLAKKKQDTSLYEEKKAVAANLRRMLERVEDIQVIDSVVVAKHDFLSAYVLAEESGTLNYLSDLFPEAPQVSSSVYMNQRGDVIYYGRPSANGQMSIYSQSKLLDGWGDETLLKLDREGSEDINYPFVMPDGVTIYYASTGSGSIGGYDLFVTRYNPNSNTYLSPEQLGMPYNSVFNDYLLVIDETKGLGWFASDRYQEEGDVCIYLFIPDPSRKRINSEDDELKRSRAMLSSIKDTWTSGANYSELVELAKRDMPFGEQQSSFDFEFVIQDNLTYYHWEDFRSREARSFYQKKQQIDQQVAQVEQQLEEMRATYAKGNASVKQRLKQGILQLEEKYSSMLREPDEWEKKARNAELVYLRKNN